MKQISKKYNSGFSIMILIVIILSIGIIATVAVVGYNSITKKSTDATAKSSLDWIKVGTQKWAKTNLNVGTMITGDKDQTDNSILEKYCYDNLEPNCATYGALYQWDEAMQYVTTEGAQGICPAGSHIPTDNEMKILEVQLGMTQAQADATSWRGAGQATQLKSGGSSGLNMPFAGFRKTDGSFGGILSHNYLWSSSESSTRAWDRLLGSDWADVYRGTNIKEFGYSVRCLEN